MYLLDYLVCNWNFFHLALLYLTLHYYYILQSFISPHDYEALLPSPGPKLAPSAEGFLKDLCPTNRLIHHDLPKFDTPVGEIMED